MDRYVKMTKIALTRFRFASHGCEQWDMPEVFIDFANMDDQSALLWNDNGKIWFFGGGHKWPKEVPGFW
jgi:hypothetical protein